MSDRSGSGRPPPKERGSFPPYPFGTKNNKSNLEGRSEPPRSPSGGPGLKGWVFPLALLFSFMVWNLATQAGGPSSEIAYSEFYHAAVSDRIESVEITGLTVEGKYKTGGERFKTNLPLIEDEKLLPLLRDKGVKIEVKSDEPSMALYTLFNIVVPALLFIGLLGWMSRRSAKMMGPFGNMMKGRAKRFEYDAEVSIKFSDVAGQEGAKRDLEEVVKFLKEPEKYRRLGGKIPRGILLVGPPGTGKTLLARAVAGEAGVPFFSINGSEFIEMFVGVGASRVRELFEEAKKVAPAIVFIDEIDAVGRARGAGLGGGHDEREQTLNQMLSEMDGFSRNDHTIVIAATNRPDVLDQALLRPGRFDRRVTVDRPELKARKAILKVHTRDKPLASDVDLGALASDTPGFSGADLSNLANEAALHATRRDADEITEADFRAAYDKIVLGDVRDSKLDPEEKRRVALHEAGHAIVAHFSAYAEPLRRVTIIPRGMALGVTQQSPAAERHMMTRPELEARLRVLMGGYAAEKNQLGDTSSGAENDLKRASEIAFSMVAHWGMSDAIGPVYYEHRTEHPFLGQRMATDGGTSDATVHAIEKESRALLIRAAQEAEKIIVEHLNTLCALRDYLLDKESIEAAELRNLLGPSVKAHGVGEADSLH